MKKITMTKKEIKKFNKDPLKWACMNVGKEIYIPREKPKYRYFVVRYDESPLKGENPDYVGELTEQEIKTLEVCNGKGRTVETLIKGLLGDKN